MVKLRATSKLNLHVMHKTPVHKIKTKPGGSDKSTASTPADTLSHLAFDNAAQPNIISTTSNGKIVMANSAACKLLGYSKRELVTKSRAAIFNIHESSFKEMLKQRSAEGQSAALITAIKKGGKLLHCEITSAVFMDGDGVEKSITTITDMSQSILKQKDSDRKKGKLFSKNIIQQQEKSDSRLVENDEWIKHIAETSYDVMWDWDIATGEIYVGDSIKEVFGYQVQNNTVTFTDFTGCLVPEEKDIVEKKIVKKLASASTGWKDSYQLRRQDGSLAFTTSRASIVRDAEGKAIHLIGATKDVSKLKELEKKLGEQMAIHEEDSEKFLLAAKLSFDVVWEWNLLTNELLLGEGFEELFGYKIKNNKGDMVTNWGNHLYLEDKEAIEKELHDAIVSSATHWEHSYRVNRANGSIAKVYVRASIIRHDNGKAYRMIGAIQDLSRQKELEEKLDQEIAAKVKLLSEYEENFKLIFNSSSDILYDVDLITNEVILSDAYEKEFGYKKVNIITSTTDWFSHIHPEDKEAFMQDYHRLLESEDTEWKHSFRFLRADNSVANVLTRSIVLRNAAGKAYRRIGFMQDISKQKVLEEKLEREIELKEMQIAAATADAKEAERLDIGKELHDNVNQLLGVSKLYLDMAKKGGGDSEMYLTRSSEYTLSAIEEIRKLTRGLTTDNIQHLGLCEAIKNVARDTMQVNPVKISSDFKSFSEKSVNDKFKVNVFRIIQEQLNNILKYARATEVRLSLVQTNSSIVLSISDNGVGFDTSQKQKGIGLSNIKSRAASFNGTADFVSRPGEGCVLTVLFSACDPTLSIR